MDIFVEKGIEIERIIASGGGAKSTLWRQLQADIFQKEIVTVSREEQAAYRAALLAKWGRGAVGNIKELVAFTRLRRAYSAEVASADVRRRWSWCHGLCPWSSTDNYKNKTFPFF